MSRMTCEEYYKTHPEPSGPGDRCAIREIEASTASSLSLSGWPKWNLCRPQLTRRSDTLRSAVVTGSTVSGVLNLLTTGYIMRRWGIRAALITQTAWPCLRNMCQITAVLVGGNVGIRLFQTTQLITILGGGAGYILCANSFVAAVVPAEERTGAFGQLSGVCMLGTAVAFTLGGLAGEYISPAAPFEITLVLLIISTFLSYFTLPYIPPAGDEKKGASGDTADGSAEKKKPGAIMSFFEPLKVFGARRLEDGQGRRYWGVTILGIRAFTSVLATAYVVSQGFIPAPASLVTDPLSRRQPFMLQLVATNLYGFKTAQNGYLMSCFAIVRAGFLTLAFPKIIKHGRAWYSGSVKPATAGGEVPTDATKAKDGAVVTVASTASRSPSPEEGAQAAVTDDETPVVKQVAPKQDTAFDLLFLRGSILVDAAMTCLVTFSSKGWHMYAGESDSPSFPGPTHTA